MPGRRRSRRGGRGAAEPQPAATRATPLPPSGRVSHVVQVETLADDEYVLEPDPAAALPLPIHLRPLPVDLLMAEGPVLTSRAERRSAQSQRHWPVSSSCACEGWKPVPDLSSPDPGEFVRPPASPRASA